MPNRKPASAALACLGLAAVLGAAPSVQPVKGAAMALENPRFLELGKLPDLAQAAGKGLEQFRSLVDSESFRDLGLADAASAAKAGLGAPKRDFLIRLDALQAFKEGGDVEALLVDTRIVHYPILLEGKAVSSISMVALEGKWETVSIGDVQRTSLRRRAIDNSVKRFAKAEEDHFVVRIPALNMEFTAFRDRSDALQLASLSDNPKAGLIAGEAEPAAKVIPRLVPLALADDGLPH